ncbi:metal cation transporter, ZIP family [Ancylostoma caninum]|uniref:Metal cation transporter, ZIP family n=1 Tax=Ancylostoma caninum TaxID=29170 RepID=A0A368GAP9_ANCCA|nr:metal cation transporter, ZIP family [Ancylostoma caninum]
MVQSTTMEGIGFLTVLSGSMFIGSYFAGSIPMMVNLSESKMRMVSIFGAGLLLGTALSVIIPEGVESLYSAHSERAHPEFHGINNPAKAKAILENVNGAKDEPPRIIPKDLAEKIDAANQGNPASRKKRETQTQVKVVSSGDNGNFTNRMKREQPQPASGVDSGGPDHEHAGNANHEDSHYGHSAHKQIGYSLVFGFIFMLLVDQISNATGARNDRSGRNRMGISATIGLVVHAAADGIALGSASTTNKSDVQLIVFVAIMLHKAPAAFGLVSFLLMEGIDARNARKHLLVFACAAPFAAVITFIILQSIGSESISSSESSTGILMLFSAGTFLFVATVHVLPELTNHGKTSMDYTLVVDAQSPATAGHSHSGMTCTFFFVFFSCMSYAK